MVITMKHSKAFLALAFVALLFPSLVRADQITVTVKGMVCSFCAQGIKKTFGKNENVKNVDVDLDKKIVKVETQPGKTIKDADIVRTINDAGYDVLKIERGNDA